MRLDRPRHAEGITRERGRMLRLVGWVAAANAVAVSLAMMPAGEQAAEGARAFLAWCGIG